jgi:hypothetical protein
MIEDGWIKFCFVQARLKESYSSGGFRCGPLGIRLEDGAMEPGCGKQLTSIEKKSGKKI